MHLHQSHEMAQLRMQDLRREAEHDRRARGCRSVGAKHSVRAAIGHALISAGERLVPLPTRGPASVIHWSGARTPDGTM